MSEINSINGYQIADKVAREFIEKNQMKELYIADTTSTSPMPLISPGTASAGSKLLDNPEKYKFLMVRVAGHITKIICTYTINTSNQGFITGVGISSLGAPQLPKLLNICIQINPEDFSIIENKSFLLSFTNNTGTATTLGEYGTLTVGTILGVN